MHLNLNAIKLKYHANKFLYKIKKVYKKCIMIKYWYLTEIAIEKYKVWKKHKRFIEKLAWRCDACIKKIFLTISI